MLYEAGCECDEPQTSAVAASVPGKDRTGDCGNLEQDVDIHQNQQHQQWKLRHQRDRVKGNKAHVVQLIKMSEHAEDGRGDNLIEAKSDESPKPTPKQKTQLVNQQERNER